MRGAAMSLSAAAGGFFLLLFALPVIQGQNGWGVTYTPTQICALKGSTVDIRCTYTYPSRINYLDTTVGQKFWYTKESNGVYVDLETDPLYSGRVEYLCGNNVCTLRITDLRESDSAEYKFRFTTNQDGKYSGKPGVTLSVTDLQVQVTRSVHNTYPSSDRADLKCHSSCLLPDHPSYVWNKNGVQVWEHLSDLYSDKWFYTTDSYSCAVKGHENTHSPLLSRPGHWGVTYSSTQICSVKGSTVEMKCTYRYPSRVNSRDTIVVKIVWFTKENDNEPVDLTNDPDYSGRVQNSCNDNTCTLTITDLRESDSAEYKFRFITNQPGGRFTGSPGVTLSFTEPQLQVQVNELSTWTELTCHSECPLHDHPSYIWYKNGQKVEGTKQYYLLPSSDPTKTYTCTLSSSLSEYPPKLPSVSVSPSGEIVEGSSVTLTCSSDANPAAKYTWYKENNRNSRSEDLQLVFSSIQSSDSGEYYCTAENNLGMRTSTYVSIDVKYPPKLPSVSVSHPGDIIENTKVILTCSSDAKPEAKYTWYKENGSDPRSEEPHLVFSSIQSSDSGEYHCTAENDLGMKTSKHVINVKYAPKLPSVSVSHPGDMIENRTVTLTCSSDANPAASYTWYKKNELKQRSKDPQLVFSSIQSSDSGEYYCTAENNLGNRTSEYFSVDVKYAPKLPSVSVSPSGEIVEGSSVNLTCSSDANPEAKYTWYKENEDSSKASGPIFTITEFRSEHSGNYYCEALNRRGRHRSTVYLTVVAGAWKLPVIGTTLAFLLAIVFLFVFLLIRKKRASRQPPNSGDTPNSREQASKDDLHYANVQFSKSRADPVYSNVGPVAARRHKEEKEEEVDYSTINFNSASAAPRTGDQATGEDLSALYSTVNKTAKHDRKL